VEDNPFFFFFFSQFLPHYGKKDFFFFFFFTIEIFSCGCGPKSCCLVLTLCPQ
jgi:hypothetical protein